MIELLNNARRYVIKTSKCKAIEVQENKYSIIPTILYHQGRKADEHILEIFPMVNEIIRVFLSLPIRRKFK